MRTSAVLYMASFYRQYFNYITPQLIEKIKYDIPGIQYKRDVLVCLSKKMSRFDESLKNIKRVIKIKRTTVLNDSYRNFFSVLTHKISFRSTVFDVF